MSDHVSVVFDVSKKIGFEPFYTLFNERLRSSHINMVDRHPEHHLEIGAVVPKHERDAAGEFWDEFCRIHNLDPHSGMRRRFTKL